MKTLLFCTSYFDSPELFTRRYERWWAFHSGIGLRFDASVVIDDASPFPAPWHGVPPAYIHSGAWPAKPLLVRFSSRYVLKTSIQSASTQNSVQALAHSTQSNYNVHAPIASQRVNIPGYQSHLGYAGWWRSFLHAATFAQRNGFEKLVHIESDAAVLSAGLVQYLNAVNSGWTALWCPRFGCPESAIQVICADQFATLFALAAQPRELLCARPAEVTLPFTHVERERFAGNRYGPLRSNIPRYADYAAQIGMQTRLVFKN